MRSAERWRPVPMQRVAVLAPEARLQDVLLALGAAGAVELERLDEAGAPDGADLQQRLDQAVRRDGVAGLTGWTPEEAVPPLAARLAPYGGAVVPLPRPRGATPPTLLRNRREGGAFGTLVDTYATVPYDDLDPTVPAGLAYVAMFAVMFGDAGHGLLLVLVGLLLRSGRPRRFSAARRVWPFVVGCGLAATAVGLAYGELFGPTGVLPWRVVDPLAEPVRLLLVGVAAGAVLLAAAYALGTANRVREGGWGYAFYAPSGLAGLTLFLGAGLVTWGVWAGVAVLVTAGAVVAGGGLVLTFLGLHAAAGGRAAGVVEAAVGLLDVVLRLGANVVSFARLAAFGLTHAALADVVWSGGTALWRRGGAGLLAAAVVVAVGNALAFALEALVAGVQALRLEYYELFSRVFQDEGRPFEPWRPAVRDAPGQGSGGEP